MSTTDSQTKTSQPRPGTRPTGFRANSAQSGTRSGVGTQSISRKSATSTAPPAFVTPAAGPALRSAPPMKKRAKGSPLAYFAWSSLLQYQSYGVIEGRLISVSTPWNGSITNWQVRDGEEVVQGQILAEIKNIEMEHELATLGDELTMSQALLEAEISKVEFEAKIQNERNQKAVAEYHETYGQLLSEMEKIKELDRKFDRTRRLLKTNTVSKSAYEKAYFELAGQRKKISQLSDAVKVLKSRSEKANQFNDGGSARIKPLIANIELSKSKIARLRQRIDQGKIRSPVNGTVTKRHRLIGEATKANETVIDILEENSVQAVLYVPQRLVDEYEIGQRIVVSLEPYTNSMECTVDRFGDRFEVAPDSIQRFYHINQTLLPVYLSPEQDTREMLAARIGGTIKRPYEYKKAFGKMLEDGKELAVGLKDSIQRTVAAPNPIEPTTNTIKEQLTSVNEESRLRDQSDESEIETAEDHPNDFAEDMPVFEKPELNEPFPTLELPELNGDTMAIEAPVASPSELDLLPAHSETPIEPGEIHENFLTPTDPQPGLIEPVELIEPRDFHSVKAHGSMTDESNRQYRSVPKMPKWNTENEPKGISGLRIRGE